MSAWVDNMSLVEVESEVDAELNDYLRELFDRLWFWSLSINNLDNDLTINSEPNAWRCELGFSGRYWIRPYYAQCVDGKNTIAWSCNTWYSEIPWVNTCIQPRYFSYLNTEFKSDLLRLTSIVSKYSETESKRQIVRINELRERAWNLSRDTKQKAALIYLMDHLLNELDKKTAQSAKDVMDLKYSFEAFKLASNDWYVYSNKDESPRYIEYAWKTRWEIKQYATLYMIKLYDIKMKYDQEFIQWHNTEKSRLLALGWTTTDIVRGLRDGTIQGWVDYMMWYYDLYNTAIDLEFEDVTDGLSKAFDFVRNPITYAVALTQEIVEISEWLKDKLLWIGWYEGGKWSWYIGSTYGAWLIDPAGKVILASWGFIGKVSRKVNSIAILSLKVDDNSRIWINWPIIQSKTIKILPWGWRIDIENPNPGQRPWQLHYQKQWDSNKYYFNFEDLKFHIWNSNGTLPSNNFQDSLLNNDDMVKALVKWKKFLDWE